ncbi:unnamed protein product [Closterium sp. NIES-53]
MSRPAFPLGSAISAVAAGLAALAAAGVAALQLRSQQRPHLAASLAAVAAALLFLALPAVAREERFIKHENPCFCFHVPPTSPPLPFPRLLSAPRPSPSRAAWHWLRAKLARRATPHGSGAGSPHSADPSATARAPSALPRPLRDPPWQLPVHALCGPARTAARRLLSVASGGPQVPPQVDRAPPAPGISHPPQSPDMRLIYTAALLLDEAPIHGMLHAPALKSHLPPSASAVDPRLCANVALRGCAVEEGWGLGVVYAVGGDTVLGALLGERAGEETDGKKGKKGKGGERVGEKRRGRRDEWEEVMGEDSDGDDDDGDEEQGGMVGMLEVKRDEGQGDWVPCAGMSHTPLPQTIPNHPYHSQPHPTTHDNTTTTTTQDDIPGTHVWPSPYSPLPSALLPSRVSTLALRLARLLGFSGVALAVVAALLFSLRQRPWQDCLLLLLSLLLLSLPDSLPLLPAVHLAETAMGLRRAGVVVRAGGERAVEAVALCRFALFHAPLLPHAPALGVSAVGAREVWGDGRGGGGAVEGGGGGDVGVWGGRGGANGADGVEVAAVLLPDGACLTAAACASGVCVRGEEGGAGKEVVKSGEEEKGAGDGNERGSAVVGQRGGEEERGESSSHNAPLPSPSPSPVPVLSPSPLPLPLQSPSPSPLPLPLQSPSPSPLPLPLHSPSPSPLPLSLHSPSPSPLPLPLQSPSPLPLPLQSPSPSPSPLPLPLHSPSPSPLPLPLQSPSPSPLPLPLHSPSPSPLPLPLHSPSPLPLPLQSPSPSPSPLPVPLQSPAPSVPPSSPAPPLPPAAAPQVASLRAVAAAWAVLCGVGAAESRMAHWQHAVRHALAGEQEATQASFSRDRGGEVGALEGIERRGDEPPGQGEGSKVWRIEGGAEGGGEERCGSSGGAGGSAAGEGEGVREGGRGGGEDGGEEGGEEGGAVQLAWWLAQCDGEGCAWMGASDDVDRAVLAALVKGMWGDGRREAAQHHQHQQQQLQQQQQQQQQKSSSGLHPVSPSLSSFINSLLSAKRSGSLLIHPLHPSHHPSNLPSHHHAPTSPPHASLTHLASSLSPSSPLGTSSPHSHPVLTAQITLTGTVGGEEREGSAVVTRGEGEDVLSMCTHVLVDCCASTCGSMGSSAGGTYGGTFCTSEAGVVGRAEADGAATKGGNGGLERGRGEVQGAGAALLGGLLDGCHVAWMDDSRRSHLVRQVQEMQQAGMRVIAWAQDLPHAPPSLHPPTPSPAHHTPSPAHPHASFPSPHQQLHEQQSPHMSSPAATCAEAAVAGAAAVQRGAGMDQRGGVSTAQQSAEEGGIVFLGAIGVREAWDLVTTKWAVDRWQDLAVQAVVMTANHCDPAHASAFPPTTTASGSGSRDDAAATAAAAVDSSGVALQCGSSGSASSAPPTAGEWIGREKSQGLLRICVAQKERKHGSPSIACSLSCGLPACCLLSPALRPQGSFLASIFTILFPRPFPSLRNPSLLPILPSLAAPFIPAHITTYTDTPLLSLTSSPSSSSPHSPPSTVLLAPLSSSPCIARKATLLLPPPPESSLLESATSSSREHVEGGEAQERRESVVDATQGQMAVVQGAVGVCRRALLLHVRAALAFHMGARLGIVAAIALSALLLGRQCSYLLVLVSPFPPHLFPAALSRSSVINPTSYFRPYFPLGDSCDPLFPPITDLSYVLPFFPPPPLLPHLLLTLPLCFSRSQTPCTSIHGTFSSLILKQTLLFEPLHLLLLDLFITLISLTAFVPSRQLSLNPSPPHHLPPPPLPPVSLSRSLLAPTLTAAACTSLPLVTLSALTLLLSLSLSPSSVPIASLATAPPPMAGTHTAVADRSIAFVLTSLLLPTVARAQWHSATHSHTLSHSHSHRTLMHSLRAPSNADLTFFAFLAFVLLLALWGGLQDALALQHIPFLLWLLLLALPIAAVMLPHWLGRGALGGLGEGERGVEMRGGAGEGAEASEALLVRSRSRS